MSSVATKGRIEYLEVDQEDWTLYIHTDQGIVYEMDDIGWWQDMRGPSGEILFERVTSDTDKAVLDQFVENLDATGALDNKYRPGSEFWR